MMSVKCNIEVVEMSRPIEMVECSARPPRSPAPGGVSPALEAGATARVPPTACPNEARQRGVRPARAARRSTRPEALADAPPPLPALAGPVAPGRDRALVRARLHGALARDPDPRPAHDRQRDRRWRLVAPDPLPRPDHGDRRGPVRRQLHAPLRDGADRDCGRGAAAGDDVRRVSPLPARLLRPPRDRRGHLARDERHLPGALLHRLGRRPGDPEHDDADRRVDRAPLGQRPADAVRRSGDATRRDPHLRLRAQGLPDLARRAGEEGPSDRGNRRGSGRDRDGAGLRARGRRARALHRARRGRARRDDAPGGNRGTLPAGPDLPPLARDRGRPLLWWPRRDCRQPDDRAVHALHHAAAAARLAARGTRLDHQPGSAGHRGCLTLLRVARFDRASRGARRSGAPPRRPVDDPDGEHPLQLRGRQRGALGRRPGGRAWRDRRRLRGHRRGQDIAPQSLAAVLRPDLGARADRRGRQP